MTCIVGIEHGGRVYVGADAAGSNGHSIEARVQPKVFTNRGYVIGYTTSFRMGQLLQYAFNPDPAPAHGIDRFMVTKFIDQMREAFKAGGYQRTRDEREDGGTFLVGVGSRLYEIGDDMQVGRVRNGYNAVGSGGLIACGSLHSTIGQAPAVRIRKALKAAEHHCATVGGPFTIRRTR